MTACAYTTSNPTTPHSPLLFKVLFITAFFSPMLNCFVHTIMYTYYMLSAFGERVRKYLWWKKYVTVLQMVRNININVQAEK